MLRKVYFEAGIKKKMIRSTKLVNEQMKAKQVKCVNLSIEHLHMLEEDGYEILFLDEMMITKRSLPKTEWSLPKQPCEYDFRQVSETPIACIAAISRRFGVELVHYHEFSIDKVKFIAFLKGLRKKAK